MKLLVLLLVQFYCVYSLNIVLTTTDSWVTKNIRLLYNDLKEQNHTVLLAGPLYQSTPNYDSNEVSRKKITDGGDFGHLLQSNQMYYQNLNKLEKLKALPRGAKNLIKKEDIERANEEQEEEPEPSSTNQYGNDPLDPNCWYVNSNNPLNTLSIFLNNIIPKHYSDFTPDLILAGPIEGETDLENLEKFSLINKIPIVTVNTLDNHHIYYQNKNMISKNNQMFKITKFVNNKIIELIEKLESNSHKNLLPTYHSLNLKFPKLFNSNCKLNSDFKISSKNQLENLTYNEFKLEGDEINFIKTVKLDLDKREEIVTYEEDVDEEERFFVDKNSNYYKYKSRVVSKPMFSDDRILGNCDIALNVNYLYKFEDFKLL